MFDAGGLVYLFNLFSGSDVEMGQTLRCGNGVFCFIWGLVSELEDYWLVYGM